MGRPDLLRAPAKLARALNKSTSLEKFNADSTSELMIPDKSVYRTSQIHMSGKRVYQDLSHYLVPLFRARHVQPSAKKKRGTFGPAPVTTARNEMQLSSSVEAFQVLHSTTCGP